jgi:hypothetical protein
MYGKIVFGFLGILLLGFARTSTSASLREARQTANANRVLSGIYAVRGYLGCVSDNSNLSYMAICI